MKIKLDTVYVSTTHMERAVQFYAELFNMTATKQSNRFSEFQFGEITFGIYNATVDDVNISFGNNCVPNFEVENIEHFFSHAKTMCENIDDNIMNVDSYHLFQCMDLDGNLLEFFEIKQ